MQLRQVLTSTLVAVATASAALGVNPGLPDAEALSTSAVPGGCDHLAWSGRDAALKSQIYVSAPDGTGRVEVSTADNTTADPVFSNTPLWSPDGTRIMWKGITSGTHIFVADPDGLNRIDITGVGANPPKLNKSPAWSPDSARIAWAGQDPITHKNEIWVANADGTARSSISNVGITPPTGNDRPAWSSDGTKIAWRGVTGGMFHVFVANADGSNRVDLIDRIDPAGVDEFGVPVWAPDGSRLAFTRKFNPSTTPTSVYTATPDGSGFVQVWLVAPEPFAYANDPVWSPDSTKLAFAAVTDAAVEALMVVGADGSGLVNIGLVPPPATRLRGVLGPVWSPTGAEIAFEGFEATSSQVYTSQVDGTGIAAISTVGPPPSPTGASASINWSPDGQTIAWRGSISGGQEIFVAANDGSSRVTISRVLPGTVPSGNDQPVWQPRSSALSLTSNLVVPTLSKPGTFSATVTNTGPCSAGAVTVDAVGAPCLAPTGHVVSRGTVAGSTWHVGTLASGASASLTISGTGTAPLDCRRTAAVGSAPSLPAPVESPVSVVVEPCPSGTDPFVDVPSTSFARADITCLNLLGITTGRTPTTYDPAEPVSREEMASFLARTWQTLGEACPTAADPFVDVSPTSFARADITCIFNVGITNGTSPVTYDPSGEVTREQMAAFLARLWRLRGTPCPAGTDPFVDVSPTSFARADIACIFNLGITTGTSAVTYDPSGEVTREQMAAFLIRLVQHT